jgi:hypothetical protein
MFVTQKTYNFYSINTNIIIVSFTRRIGILNRIEKIAIFCYFLHKTFYSNALF